MRDATIYEANFDSFEGRAVQLGYGRSSSEWLRFIFQEIDWPHRIWRQFNSRDSVAGDEWFDECQRRKIPFMYIEKKANNFSFYWDHITADPDYDKMILNHPDGDVGKILFHIFQYIARMCKSKGIFDGSALVGDITGLTESCAREIANSFALKLFPGNVKSALAA